MGKVKCRLDECRWTWAQMRAIRMKKTSSVFICSQHDKQEGERYGGWLVWVV